VNNSYLVPPQTFTTLHLYFTPLDDDIAKDTLLLINLDVDIPLTLIIQAVRRK